MLSRSGRSLAQKVFEPIAKVFIKLGISADVVTIVGTLLTILTAMILFPLNHLLLGTILGAVLVAFDSLDGQIARLTNSQSTWGAFLDSTMDRFSDAAIFIGLIMWGYTSADDSVKIWVMTGGLAALVFGAIVPYARARAEGVGLTASVGIAERADRIVLTGICTFLVGLGLSHWIMAIGLWLLGILAFITVIQRMYVVYKQCK